MAQTTDRYDSNPTVQLGLNPTVRIHGDAHKLSPYRVEWRPDLVTHWVLLGGADSHDQALSAVDRALQRFNGGQARAVSQHVIDAKGVCL